MRHDKTARLAWGGAVGAHGNEGRESKEDAGVERGSPLICLYSKNYKKIKSNGERRVEKIVSKAHSLLPKGWCWGKKKKRKEQAVLEICLLRELFQACH